MREIKFRGMNLCGKWVYGDLRHDRMCMPDGKLQEYISVCGEPIHPKSVGQYTGLKDCEGREIYEGDVLNNSYGRLGVSYKQEWAAFVARGIDATGYYHEYLLDEVVNTPVQGLEIKVIGNVHDNPELARNLA